MYDVLLFNWRNKQRNKQTNKQGLTYSKIQFFHNYKEDILLSCTIHVLFLSENHFFV